MSAKSNAQNSLATTGKGSSTAQLSKYSIPAGMLNRRVTIMQRLDPPDGGGGGVDQWVPLFTCWAAIRGQTGREAFTSEQVQERIYYVITIRYRLGVTPAMQVTYKNRTWNIRSVVDLGEQQTQIQLLCEELQGVGITQ